MSATHEPQTSPTSATGGEDGLVVGQPVTEHRAPEGAPTAQQPDQPEEESEMTLTRRRRRKPDLEERMEGAGTDPGDSQNARDERPIDENVLALLGELVAEGHLEIGPFAVLMVVVCALAAREARGHHVRVLGRGDDARVEYLKSWGLVAGDALRANWETHLDALVRGGWLVRTTHGPTVHLGPGPTWKMIVAGKGARKVKAALERRAA